jgi:hypothetical protein
MENKVLAATYKKNVGSDSKVGSKTGITWKKHNQVMNAAQELLYKADNTHTTIYDSLNCGKLARLFAYINSGSVAVLMWVNCYSEHVWG